ncbi:MAG TPA: hemerythrin domain-containing protein [Deltaproteobacteria bacterium]|nr:hemerythrin domain-containing protein [Deltaproteobacteria bacterium]
MQPTEELKHEHDIILRVLDAASFEVLRISQTYKINPGKTAAMLDFFKGFVDRCHHTKEELHLFPMMGRRGQPRETGPLAIMTEEHIMGRIYLKTAAKALTLVDKGDQASIDEVGGNLGAYVDLLKAHIAKENTILFPLADSILTPQDQAELEKAFAEVESSIIGPEAHEKYHQLANELART